MYFLKLAKAQPLAQVLPYTISIFVLEVQERRKRARLTNLMYSGVTGNSRRGGGAGGRVPPPSAPPPETSDREILLTYREKRGKKNGKGGNGKEKKEIVKGKVEK